jgi:NAD(P)-dependent dehydrogenase (short-subunit alcohol dehydrogenase family)
MKAAQASVVLTGAAGGIGAPTARALAAAGARLCWSGATARGSRPWPLRWAPPGSPPT